MIDTIMGYVAAYYWRWRVARNEEAKDWSKGFMQWKREHPDRCMYCAYTAWVKLERNVTLPIQSHACVEGHSPQPIPTARIL